MIDIDSQNTYVNNEISLIKTNLSELTIHKIFENDELAKKCVTDIDLKLLVRPPITIYSKTVYQNRSIGFFSDNSIGYYYSGQLAKSQPLTNNLKELLNIINNYFSTDYNGILINKYSDGNDYIGAHSDDEKNLSNVGVVCLSFGAIRKFRIRNKITKQIIMDIPTTSNEIIKMSGNFQEEFTH